MNTAHAIADRAERGATSPPPPPSPPAPAPAPAGPRSAARTVVERQGAALRAVLAPFVAPGAPYALLDFPDHANIGDSAIWLGETAVLRELAGRPPAYACSTRNLDVDRLRRAVPEGPILLHGGGNFGDIYERHQGFREHVMATFPDRTIVQLPQTIHYRDPARIAATARALTAHGDVHLLVRDRRSLALAERHFGGATLAPDCAPTMGPLARRPAETDTLLMLREDVERVRRDGVAALSDAGPVDWPAEDGRFHARARREAVLRCLLTGRVGRDARRVVLYETLARRRLRRAVRLLSRGRFVVTDRLHGHILCLLLGIPHVALDNDYGKVHAYAREWTHEAATVRLATGPQEAAAALDDLRAAFPQEARS